MTMHAINTYFLAAADDVGDDEMDEIDISWPLTIDVGDDEMDGIDLSWPLTIDGGDDKMGGVDLFWSLTIDGGDEVEDVTYFPVASDDDNGDETFLDNADGTRLDDLREHVL